MLSKRGEIETPLFLFLILLLLTFMVGALTWGMHGYLHTLSVPQEEAKILALTLRFTHNPDCFAYVDPLTKNIDVASVDLTKFTPERMNNCYSTDPTQNHRGYNFNLLLPTFEQEVASSHYYHNRVDFTMTRSVRVYNASKFIGEDVLFIYAQQPLGGSLS